MPDFTQIVYFHCQSVASYETEVKGSTGKVYKVRVAYVGIAAQTRYEFTCECQGFKFRQMCKHIKKAQNDPAYCGWFEQIHGGEIVRDDVGVARCPKCNNLAISLRYAV